MWLIEWHQYQWPSTTFKVTFLFKTFLTPVSREIQHINKAMVYIRLCPRCAIPPPRSRPIGCIGCARKFSEQPRKLFLPVGDLHPNPINTWFRGPIRVFIENGTSIGLAVFAQRTVYCPISFQWDATFSPKIDPCLSGSGPHLTHGT